MSLSPTCSTLVSSSPSCSTLVSESSQLSPILQTDTTEETVSWTKGNRISSYPTGSMDSSLMPRYRISSYSIGLVFLVDASLLEYRRIL